MTGMTKELAQELLVGATEGPWSVPGQPDKVCVEGYTKNGWGKVILSASSPSWMRLDEPACNALLAAAAPDLARAYLDTLAALEAARAENEALRAERDRINQWRETAIVERDTYSEERDAALTRLAAAQAEVTALLNAAENVVIALNMGWDVDGVLAALEDAVSTALAAHDSRNDKEGG